ncbi:phospholipid/cholesterol/gamma-HCH transport system substrate-binding protein [Saccharopolyspora antimicrobica]|uniref:Phospholipid/cholesterol/gamma-HCH transport system substrate-binding protein n=1 Tax=Saccharopolyspora antimicrobica TaxID=455193 RepID=A0A1I5J2L4_9PSEU|nr:MCE family protein [Saccharopolyspora antimicrobica]RKT81974.1 phospholipid/cholesterol/gamma-HCH transport system substrate-binding protein [Saccharopolyspora antimicrobica]SFO66987.1 phospholipid/cholesterol/gamma-HCH transport system substrate-binding protein [Saccharopolyspora antimicrobica]
MKPLRERNQAVVGVVTIVLLVLVTSGAFFAKDLPVLGGSTYQAYFTESAGLAAGNDVRIAGIRSGEVTDVSLEGNRVLVSFRVDDAEVGDRSRAGIEIKTLLGEKFLALQPEGEQELSEPIPVERTAAPFDIPDALDQLTRTADEVDGEQLAQSFRVLADTFRGAPEHFGEAVDGLSALSQTISSRDQQLSELLRNTSGVSRIVADRDEQVQRLIADGNLLLTELQQRRGAISSLLSGTQKLSDELRGLVADNQAQLRPTLDQLNQLTEMLQRNQDNLGRTIEAMAPYVRGFNNTVGNGRWFDGYICGLFPPPINAGPLQTNTTSCELPVPTRPVGGD